MFEFRVEKKTIEDEKGFEEWVAHRLALMVEGPANTCAEEGQLFGRTGDNAETCHRWRLGTGNDWWLSLVGEKEAETTSLRHTRVDCFVYRVSARYTQDPEFLAAFKKVVVRFLYLDHVNFAADDLTLVDL